MRLKKLQLIEKQWLHYVKSWPDQLRCQLLVSASLSVYLGTTLNKHQITHHRKTSHKRTTLILLPGHLK